MLKLQAREPQKIVLREALGNPDDEGFEPEAFIIMAPITEPMRRRADRATRRALGTIETVDDADFDMIADAVLLQARELMRLGALEWGGIGDADDNPLALTPDRDTRFATVNDEARPTGSLDLLLADEDVFNKLFADYTRPDAIRRAEKNALSASPNGTGGAGTRARTIAGSPARRTAKKTAAASAPIAKTRCKAKPAKKSGRR